MNKDVQLVQDGSISGVVFAQQILEQFGRQLSVAEHCI
jgi:hypothetical protein